MLELLRSNSEEGAAATGDDGQIQNELVAEQGSDILSTYRQIAGGRFDLIPCRFSEVRSGADWHSLAQAILLSHFLTMVICQGVVLGRAAACHISRFLFKRSPLGRGRATLLKWITDMLDRTKQVRFWLHMSLPFPITGSCGLMRSSDLLQVPGTRAKAVKALGMIVEADTRLLARPEVHLCDHAALFTLPPSHSLLHSLPVGLFCNLLCGL